MRVLITGSRDWVDSKAIAERFMRVARDAAAAGVSVTLISGACPTGADAIGEQLAYELGWKIERHPADWATYGKAAGFVRNALMVNERAPDVCYAFIRNGSKGASMTAAIAEKAGVPTFRDII